MVKNDSSSGLFYEILMIVELLMKNSYIEINILDVNDYTTFHYICLSGYFEIVQILINDLIIKMNNYNILNKTRFLFCLFT